MAKWIYEKWDTKWDWDKLSEVSKFSDRGSSETYKFSRPAFSEYDESWTNKIISYGDIFTGAYKRDWDEGATSIIYIATSNQTTSWTPIPQLPSGGTAFASVDVRHTVESDYTKDTMYRLKNKNVLMESGIIAEDGTYPDDGIHTDGYWYVKIKKAFPTMRILRDGQWVEVETGYVLKDGVWKQIEEIYKLQDGQWVQA